MFVNVTLCKTPINTTDTLFFKNATAQKAYFNGIKEKKTYGRASFNGSRSFRIPVNYLEAVNTRYNYMYYTYADRVWYCFIDNYSYVNDTCCDVNVTLDFIQTFMFDITWKSSRIASFTWKKAHFENGYVPYSNKFPSAEKNFSLIEKCTSYAKLQDGSIKQPIVWLHITVNPKIILDGRINILCDLGNAFTEISDKKNITENVIKGSIKTIRNSIALPYYTFIFPLNGETLEPLQLKFTSPSYTKDIRDIGSFITEFIIQHSAYIIDISICGGEYGAFTYEAPSGDTQIFYRIEELDSSEQGKYSKDGLVKTIIEHGDIANPSSQQFCYMAYIAQSFEQMTGTLPQNGNVYAQHQIAIDDVELSREPYKSIIIGNSVSYEEIEINDTILKKIEAQHSLNYFVEYEITPPFFTTITIGVVDKETSIIEQIDSYDKTLRFTLDLAKPVPYEVTAWAEYYAQNSRSVNDGLKTKHGYEKEIAKRNMVNTTVQGALGIGIGIIGTLIGGVFKSSQALVGGISQMASGGSQIADSQVQYENTLTNMQKERALLELSWNDIKSAPSEAVNALIPSLSVSSFDNMYASVYMCEAINLGDIKKYHKIYGYQTEEVVDVNELKQQHTVFDYIRFEEANFITNLPHNTHQIIKRIFESGIRFWYDEDNFLNFDIDNPEN